MKTRSRVLQAALLVTVLAAIPLFAGARPGAAGAAGYSPSRIEWTCVYLNSLAHEELSETTRYGVLYSYNGADPNTVLVRVSHFADFDRDRLNMVINNARDLAIHYAHTRGWSWMQVRVDTSVFDPTPPEPAPASTKPGGE